MFETLERADWHETLCSLEYLNAELIALNSIESQKQVIQHALKIYPENGALYLILAELLFKNSDSQQKSDERLFVKGINNAKIRSSRK